MSRSIGCRSASPPEDLVDRAIGKRNDKEIVVRPGFDVGGDAKVAADQQALALGYLMFRQVVCNAIFQPGIASTT